MVTPNWKALTHTLENSSVLSEIRQLQFQSAVVPCYDGNIQGRGIKVGLWCKVLRKHMGWETLSVKNIFIVQAVLPKQFAEKAISQVALL